MSGSGPAPDVVVIGGGIVGTSAAAFAAEAGARVLLVEREGLASGASGANSGVVQHPFDPVLVALYERTLERYRRLADTSTSFRLDANPAGMLFVATEQSAARAFATRVSTVFPDLETEVVGEQALERLDPAIASGLWACRIDVGYPVMPGASTYGYASLAESLGAVIRVGRSARLRLEGDRAVGVTLDGMTIPAGSVLAAAGPWTPELIDPTGHWRPILPRWGVVVEAELAAPPRHVLEEAGIDAAIGVPTDVADPEHGGVALGSADGVGDAAETAEVREPGGHPELAFSLVPLPGASAVGSTFLPDEPRPQDWMEPILVGASRYVPAVADAPIRGLRVCARPQSIDGRPLVGAVPGIRDLYVCAGHGPWGISTGPGSARLVVDRILGRPVDVDPALDPARFGAPAIGGRPR